MTGASLSSEPRPADERSQLQPGLASGALAIAVAHGLLAFIDSAPLCRAAANVFSARARLRPFCARCSQCHRPAFLFGSIDERTGWRGWCVICNWHWHHPDVVGYRVWHRSMERQSNLVRAVLSLVGTFLIDSKRAHAELQSMKDDALLVR